MKKYNVAIDLGTTTIELCIIDADTKKAVCYDYFKNRQSLYGSDVINRIFAVERNNDNLEKLRSMVIDDIKLSIIRRCEENSIDISLICEIVFSGNTTMNSILLGYDVRSLGKYPFKNVLTENVIKYDDELFGGAFLGLEKTIFLRGASAFIGGDVLSGIIYLKENSLLNDKTLLLDLGTNGEMVLFYKGYYYATSASCGPAFEGAVRKQNAYGTNVIDAISMGINARKITREGMLKDDYLENGVDIMGIKLTSSVIHEIILAKAAIITGIQILLKEADITENDIDTVYVAGNFGFYLNINSAYNIKMLPEGFKGKIKTIGNASIEGAKLICNNSELLTDIDEVLAKEKFRIIQPSLNEQYQNILLNNMTF